MALAVAFAAAPGASSSASAAPRRPPAGLRRSAPSAGPRRAASSRAGLAVSLGLAAALRLRAGRRGGRRQPELRRAVAAEGGKASTAEEASSAGPWTDHKITVLFDGACNVCLWEINLLKSRQEELGASSILFIDLAGDDYDPQVWRGVDTLTAAGIEGRGIHGILPSGEVTYGIPVFRSLYDELGWGWLFAAHDLPGFRELIEAGYYVFAVNRLRVTGRWEEDARLREALDRRLQGCEACEQQAAGEAAAA